MSMVPEKVPPVERNKAWHEKTPDERYADIIRNYEERHRNQVSAISRLVSTPGMRLSQVRTDGTAVLFKLADDFVEMTRSDGRGDTMYAEIQSSTVDSAGRVIVTLKAVDI